MEHLEARIDGTSDGRCRHSGLRHWRGPEDTAQPSGVPWDRAQGHCDGVRIAQDGGVRVETSKAAPHGYFL